MAAQCPGTLHPSCELTDCRLQEAVGVVVPQHDELQGSLVAHHVALEAPLPTQDVCQQLLVGTGRNAIDPVGEGMGQPSASWALTTPQASEPMQPLSVPVVAAHEAVGASTHTGLELGQECGAQVPLQHLQGPHAA